LFFFGNSGNGNLKTIDPKTKKVATFDALASDCPISLDVSELGALYASTRCGDAPSVANGKVYKFSFPSGVARLEQDPFRISQDQVMQWRCQPGRGLSIQLLRSGLQTLELWSSDGRLINRLVAEEASRIILPGLPGKGLYFLVWKSGPRKSIAKILMED